MPRICFSRSLVLSIIIFTGLLAACGPGAARPIAAVPATLRGPAMTTDGASATPTATPTETPTPVPAPTDTPTATSVPVPTDTPTPAPVPTGTPTPAVPTSTPVSPPTATPTPPPGSTPTPPAVSVDLAAQKTAQCDPSAGACTFAITVVNNGPGTYSGGLGTQDVISPTVPFTVTAFGGDGGTICYRSGPALNCGPHYPLSLLPGGTYHLTLMVQVGAAGSFQNCVTVQVQDTNPANNQACVGFSVTATGSPGAPDLSVQK